MKLLNKKSSLEKAWDKTPFQPLNITINNKPFKLLQKTLSVFIEDELAWLESQSHYPKIYWKEKSQLTLLSIGSLCDFDTLPELKILTPSTYKPRLFGGSFFDKQHNKKINPWVGLKEERFFLPEIMAFKKENHQVDIVLQTFNENHFSQIIWEEPTEMLTSNPLIKRRNIPEKNDYEKIFQLALQDFEKKFLKKVVLSRAVELEFKNVLSPFSWIRHLKKHSENATLFSWMFNKNSSFIGCTPEHLYKRQYRKIFTHAVAGTQARKSAKNHTDKDLKEFDYVSDYMNLCMDTLCVSYEKKDITTLSTTLAKHLCQEFNGLLKPSISDSEICSKLHPTPAMGGFPKQEAQIWIRKFEPYNRGFYSSYLGWFSDDFAEAIVGIRSGLIRKNFLYLFSGGGLIKESNIDQEWEELELKILHFLKYYEDGYNAP